MHVHMQSVLVIKLEIMIMESEDDRIISAYILTVHFHVRIYEQYKIKSINILEFEMNK